MKYNDPEQEEESIEVNIGEVDSELIERLKEIVEKGTSEFLN